MSKSKLALAETLAILAAAAATAVPAFAMARDTSAPTSGAVKFDDLNLMNADGQRTLERRVARVAREVCGLDRITTGSRMRSPAAQSCYEQAVKSVRSQVAAAIENNRRGG